MSKREEVLAKAERMKENIAMVMSGHWCIWMDPNSKMCCRNKKICDRKIEECEPPGYEDVDW